MGDRFINSGIFAFADFPNPFSNGNKDVGVPLKTRESGENGL